MNQIEVIDRLCDIVRSQAEIINGQAAVIAEQLAVDDAIRGQFSERRGEVDAKLGRLRKEGVEV